MRRKILLYGLFSTAAILIISAGLLINNANKLISYELRRFLGTGSSVQDISIRWGHVQAKNVSLLRADNKEVFSVKDLDVRASFISLLKKENKISGITLDGPTMFIEANKKGDILFPWPSKEQETDKGRQTNKPAEKNPIPFLINRLKVIKGSLDYLDRKLPAKPALIQLRDIEASITDFSVPVASRLSAYEFEASIPGKTKRGSLKAVGTIDLKTKDSKTKLEMRNLDITQLRPYYEKEGDAEVTGGLLAINADIHTQDSKINATGKITLNGLAFRTNGGSLLGLPLLAVTNLLKDNNNEISFDFTIAGDMSNPKFSITESLIQKLSLSLATSLGMPIESISKSVFDLGGSALKRLLK